MKRTAIIVALAATVALTACGSDSGGSSSELSGPQADAAQTAVDSAAESGVTLDRDCVNELAAQLSDEDAVLAAAEGDAQLSPEGEALTVQLISCADADEMIDGMIDAMGEGFDEACVREALEDLDLTSLMSATGDGAEPPAEFVEALTPCFQG
jgi:hypothetical protein